MEAEADKLRELRKETFDHWHTTLWLLNRDLRAKEASYSVLRVETAPDLTRKLKDLLVSKVQKEDLVPVPYDFLSTDQDNRVLTIASSVTDFQLILAELQRGLDNTKAKKFEELLGSWAYIIQLKHGDKTLYGLRRIHKLNKAKKATHWKTLMFQKEMLVDLDDRRLFTIDTRLDFFAYDEVIFIMNKKEFETALNFRRGMELNREAITAEFKQLALFKDADLISKSVGKDMHMLRRLSIAKRLGFYKDSDYMTKLKELIITQCWKNVPIENGQLVVTETNVQEILTLISDLRVQSMVRGAVQDVQIPGKPVP